MSQATPFTISVSDAELADLRERLARTRLPIAAHGAPWEFGTSLDYVRDIVRRWSSEYDWRLWEARLNATPNYRADIDGKLVHFMMEPGSGPRPLPLLLTHGWPGSVAEFLDVIDPLAHPERHGGRLEDAFTVIVPSLPGYGFSEAPDRPISYQRIADIWHALMTSALGIPRYAVQGGDVGAVVSSWLALRHPGDVIALHLNMVGLLPHVDPVSSPLTEDERRWEARTKERESGETAYQQIQGTKPQTLAYGLTDSPAGLAAWILEKFHGWTVPGSDGPPPFDPDHLITNVMLHWLGGPNAPTWTYLFGRGGSGRRLGQGERVAADTGVLLFPQDIALPPPDAWIRRAYNLVHRTDAPSGGHFAALENGPLFVEEIREFFRAYRD